MTNLTPTQDRPSGPSTQEPMVVAVGGLKGGIGKSTLAMFVAFVYVLVYGKKVLLVDADPSSQTAYDWWMLARQSGEELPFAIETWPHARVGQMIADRTPGEYDVVVVDCGGDSDAILSSAVAVCHFALIATTAFRADVRRVAATFHAAAKSAQEAGRAEEITASVVFLKVDNRMGGKNQARQEAVKERLPVLEGKMSHRPAVYADAFAEGPPDLGDLEEVKGILIELGAAK